MISVSERFDAMVRYSGRRKTVVDIYDGSSLSTPLFSDITVSEGSITMDRTADVRRSGSITLSSNSIALDSLDPSHLEIHIRSGFEFADRTTELVSLGWFRTETFRRKEGNGRGDHLTLDLFDRSKVLQDNVILVHGNVAGRTVQAVIDLQMSYCFSPLGYAPIVNWGATIDKLKRLPGGSTTQGTSLEVSRLMAGTLGAEFYFDHDGNVQIDVPPKVDQSLTLDDVSFAIDVGENGVLVSADHVISRAETYNVVGVFGPTVENQKRIYAIAVDGDPASNTYYSGRFGRKTKRIEVDTGVSFADMTKMAQTELMNSVGLTKKLQFESLWHPALVPGDIVLASYLDETSEMHLIDSIGIDLMSGTASCNTRTKQYVA